MPPTKSNLDYIDELREAARKVDSDDNPYRAIVSVLMLREGWDMRNVVVIVPLRPYTAKANILPEQTLGRGLRLMQAPGAGWDENVIVIEHEAFRDFWDKELKEEGLEIERRRLEQTPKPPETILVDQAKLQYDLEIPQLSPALTKSAARLSDLTIEMLPQRAFKKPTGGRVAEETIRYVGRDMLTKEVVEEQDLIIPLPDRPEGVISYFANMILRYAHLPGRFAELAPVIEQYLTAGLFDAPAQLNDPAVIKRLSQQVAQPLGDVEQGVFRQGNAIGPEHGNRPDLRLIEPKKSPKPASTSLRRATRYRIRSRNEAIGLRHLVYRVARLS